MRRSVELQIITEALQTGPGTNRRAAHIWGRAQGAPYTSGAEGNVWTGNVHDVALHIVTRLYGRPETTPEASPLAQAEAAKRRRNIEDEIAALTGGHDQLTTAPWYPARPGDLLHIHYERASQDLPPFGETYIVGDADNNLMNLQLLAHTLPETVPGMDAETTAAMAGCFASEASDEPLYEAWFEAGPSSLTIVRDGRPVHIGGAR